MTEQPLPILTLDPHIEPLQRALDAAERSLRILEEAGDDQASVLKAARAVADISQKIARLTPEPLHRDTPERKKIMAEIIRLIIDDLEGDMEHRLAAVEALQRDLKNL